MTKKIEDIDDILKSILSAGNAGDLHIPVDVNANHIKTAIEILMKRRITIGEAISSVKNIDTYDSAFKKALENVSNTIDIVKQGDIVMPIVPHYDTVIERIIGKLIDVKGLLLELVHHNPEVYMLTGEVIIKKAEELANTRGMNISSTMMNEGELPTTPAGQGGLKVVN